MDWIAWDHTLKTGYAKLDADHHDLAQLFNRLADAVDNREGKKSCLSALDDIVRHARIHFELEERLMAQHHYPKSGQHKAEHAMLIGQALDYRSTFEVDATESPIAVAHFPEVWLAFHILFSDKQLADFLARSA